MSSTAPALHRKPTQAATQRKLYQAADAQYYSQVRASIRTGDVLLFRGTSRMSRIIQWGSDSVYSHAGFTAWWGPRLLVFQSTSRGAEVLPVSTAVDVYDGQVDLFRLDDALYARLDPEALVTCAVGLLGRRYASLSLLGLMWRMARRRFRGRPDATGEPQEVFCSQYVSYCFRSQALDLVDGTDDASTSPGDLALSPHLRLAAVLHDDPQTAARRREDAVAGQARLRAR